MAQLYFVQELPRRRARGLVPTHAAIAMAAAVAVLLVLLAMGAVYVWA